VADTEETTENTEGDPDKPDSTAEADTQMNTPFISCAAQIYEQKQKITCKNLHQYM
jgi:hypothetical protein